MSNEEMRARQLPEPPGVANRAVTMSVAGFFALVLVSMAVLFVYLRGNVPAAFRPPVKQSFPEPRLQVVPRADLIALESQQRARLSSYGWVDREKGIARIPIEEAMRAVVERGDRAYDPPGQPTAANADATNGAGR
jgi:hypothetical protein